ncbi:MAG: right-handed parallel beta-helix repeat-containing protein, partial [Kiritimatiellaeota bacterium]|nr:right-handed parallel beta-helix repeat-containing protein [Kiritimatiellota bacterium]
MDAGGRRGSLKGSRLSVALLTLTLFVTATRAATVNISGGGTALQTAIDNAKAGDILLVAPGTYSPISTANKAITIESTGGAEVTIIDGGDVSRCATLGSAEGHTNTVLSGFTLMNGNSTYIVSREGGGAYNGTLNNCVLTNNMASTSRGGGAAYSTLNNCMLTGNTASSGGGVYECTLNNCTLTGNAATGTGNGGGGGAYGSTLNNCTLTGNTTTASSSGGGGAHDCILMNCVLSGNTTEGSGGGAYFGRLNNCTLTGNMAARGSGGGAYGCREMNNCTLENNTASSNGGGGVCDCTLSNCTLTGNTATYGGGAYDCTLNNCTLENNMATEQGGGTYGRSLSSSTLTNCVLAGNTAKYGAGAYRGTLNNCVLSGNAAGYYGGGAHSGRLNNCTLTGNSAFSDGGGANGGTLRNCIVWGNTVSSGTSSNHTSGTFTYSCTAPLPIGIGNIAADPLFADAANGDFHLQEGSPCINKGYNAYAPGDSDLDGNPRIYNGTVDMGAYEYMPTPPPAPTGVSASTTYTDRITVSWSSATGATSYKVYRNTADNSASATQIGTPTASPYNDTTAVAGTTYYYWVKASNSAGDSGFSASAQGLRTVAVTIPPAPTGVSASTTYTDRITVSWSSATGAASYKVYRNTANNSASATQIGTPTASPYNDTTAVAGTAYYYWVKASNSAGDSGFSASAQGLRTVAVTIPPAPTGVSASTTYTDRITVAWSSATGAASYKVYRNTADNSASATQIGTPTTSPYNDTTAVAGTAYYYWVKASNIAGDSGFSASAQGLRTVAVTIPPAPTGVSASTTYTDRITVAWSSATGATSYKVYRNTANNSASATQIGTPTTSPYNDTTAVAGTTYYYWVKASNSAGDSGFSASAQGSLRADGQQDSYLSDPADGAEGGPVQTTAYDGFLYDASKTVRGTVTLKATAKVKADKKMGIVTTNWTVSAKAVVQATSVSFSGKPVGALERFTAYTTKGERLDVFMQGDRFYGTVSGGKVGGTFTVDGARSVFADKKDEGAKGRLDKFR